MQKHTQHLEKDFIVIGGGLSGVCAAIAAARHGMSVLICQDRSVLGGNSSSECRVWACGASAMGFNRYADETGIISELLQENLLRNPDGNPHLWDALLLDFVMAEKNIQLLLETRMVEAHAENGRVLWLRCEQYCSETTFILSAPLFADCTGDAILSELVDAQTIMGNEDVSDAARLRFELDDSYASLGSTMLFYTKKVDHPVKFFAPAFAFSVEQIEDLLNQNSKVIFAQDTGCDYWWLEYGGLLNTIRDNEEIRFTLTRLLYGVWNYIKNSGKYDADHLTLEWVGSMPARRESRRAVARYTLNEDDLFSHRTFPDAVCYGGWPVDTHPSSGFFDRRKSCTQLPVDPYDIPLSSLILRDYPNVLLAGRNAGMNHIAMASARVMKTCAVEGQAIGTAAALAEQHGILPHQFSDAQLLSLQNTLLRDDAWIPGRRLFAESDLAQRMTVSSSEPLKPDTGFDGQLRTMPADAYVMLPPLRRGAQIMLRLGADHDCQYTMSIFDSGDGGVYKPNHLLCECSLALTAGLNVVKLTCPEDSKGNVTIWIPQSEGIQIGLARSPIPGILGVFSSNALGTDCFAPAVTLEGMDDLYASDAIHDGYTRPFAGQHVWVSPLADAWLRLDANTPEPVDEVVLYLENALYRLNNNLRPKRDPLWNEYIHPGLLRDFTLRVSGPDGEKCFTIRDNVQRRVAIPLSGFRVSSVHLLPEATHGAAYAALHEIALFTAEQSSDEKTTFNG